MYAYKKNKIEQWEIFICLNPKIHLKIMSYIKIGEYKPLENSSTRFRYGTGHYMSFRSIRNGTSDWIHRV